MRERGLQSHVSFHPHHRTCHRAAVRMDLDVPAGSHATVRGPHSTAPSPDKAGDLRELTDGSGSFISVHRFE
ncbi:hypothetical protein ABT300_36505 [Streptomyces sp. NPDC001027]|uniref:hypothetical protein n=1 Tax=Streptomyces sp. NPDC001027 TaxID=3154771 RepID=UPI00331B37C5